MAYSQTSSTTFLRPSTHQRAEGRPTPRRLVGIDDSLSLAMLQELSLDSPLGLDTETTGLSPFDSFPLLLQVSDGDVTVVLLWREIGKRTRGWLGDVLGGDGVLKIGHNLDFEYRWIKHHLGISLRRLFDTQVAEQILRMGLEGGTPHLKELSKRYLDVDLNKEIRQHFIDADPSTWLPWEEDIDYAALDAEVVLPIAREQMHALRQEGLVPGAKLRMDMIPVVGDMELEGAPLNVDVWRPEVERMAEALSELERDLVEQLTPHIVNSRTAAYTAALDQRRAFEAEYDNFKALNESMVVLENDCEIRSGKPTGLICDSHWCVPTKRARRDQINEMNRRWRDAWVRKNGKVPVIPKMDHGPINLGSWQQLQAAYADLGIYLSSTEADELERVADQHPSVRPLLDWKKLKKLESTYGRSFLEKVVEHDDGTKRIHPSFNLVVSTGRMSCREPNIQNCPPNLRAAFRAPGGYSFLIADYSQIELRILADLSGDPDMIKNYELGRDLHTATAARKVGISYEEALDRLERYKLYSKNGRAFRPEDVELYHARNDTGRGAKAANFGVIYGKADPALIELFSNSFPVAWDWIKKQGQLGWTRGWTVTGSGLRRRYANRLPPDLSRSERWSYRAHIERAAMNAPIQGTSADITQEAAVTVHRELPEVRLWNLVHDELDGLVRSDQSEVLAPQVRDLCIGAAKKYLTRVPIEVEVNIAQTWSK